KQKSYGVRPGEYGGSSSTVMHLSAKNCFTESAFMSLGLRHRASSLYQLGLS
ncbi:hypothetical protein TNCV_2316761, partial [Trichonephila clavipes]